MEAMDIKYRPVLFPNGAVKKLKPVSAAAVAGESVYRECLKNHAASLGGHAVDGCGEFMPSPAANPSDPTSLKCAACGCHRNFHRRLPDASASPPPPGLPALPAAMPPPASLLHGLPHRGDEQPEDRLPGVDGDESDSDSDASDYDDDRSASPPPPHSLPAPVAQQPPPGYFSSAPHMLLALSSGAPAAAAPRPPAPGPPVPPPPPPRKRFRTKFTSEQKQRMQELSERLGWRLQKRDEAVVDEWCREIGVGKGVFKVWMHNNKHNFLGGHSARRSASSAAAIAAAALHSSTPTPTPTPPPPQHSSPPPTTTDFNINGAACSTPAGPTATGIHPANGGSPPHSA